MTNPDADDRPPWEMPGALRRDVLPQRADLLEGMAGWTWLCAIACPPIPIPVIFGLPLGVAVIVMASSDLAAMGRGEVDAAARWRTAKALVMAAGGLVLNLVPVALLVWILARL